LYVRRRVVTPDDKDQNMIRVNRKLVILTLLGLFLAACATGPRLYSTQNPQADFSSYSTYGYVSQLGTDELGAPASLLTQFLRAAVDREMQARDYRYVDQGGDLLVNFYVETQEKIRSRTSMPSSGTYPGRGYYGYRGGYYGTWGGYSETEITQYTEGTLNIDLVDARREELLWEGVAVGQITEEARRDVQAAVDAIVPQIFEQNPAL